MKQKVIIDRDVAQEFIIDNEKEFICTRDYYELVANILGCPKSHLGFLQTIPEVCGDDDEGWNLESFFPEGSEIKQIVLFEDLHLPSTDCMYSIGEVVLLEVDGVRYVAEHNASPWDIYAKTF